MKRMMSWALALSMVGSVAMAQESVTRTETKTESSEAPAPASVTRTESSEVRSAAPATATSSKTVISYDDRLSAAYKSAGIPEEKVTKLRAVDTRYREARKKDKNVKIEEYRTEQERIVTPEEATKIRTYFREHPVAERPAEYEATTWEYQETTPGTGVQINTPLGSVGVGTPPQTTTRQETVVTPR